MLMTRNTAARIVVPLLAVIAAGVREQLRLILCDDDHRPRPDRADELDDHGRHRRRGDRHKTVHIAHRPGARVQGKRCERHLVQGHEAEAVGAELAVAQSAVSTCSP